MPMLVHCRHAVRRRPVPHPPTWNALSPSTSSSFDADRTVEHEDVECGVEGWNLFDKVTELFSHAESSSSCRVLTSGACDSLLLQRAERRSAVVLYGVTSFVVQYVVKSDIMDTSIFVISLRHLEQWCAEASGAQAGTLQCRSRGCRPNKTAEVKRMSMCCRVVLYGLVSTVSLQFLLCCQHFLDWLSSLNELLHHGVQLREVVLALLDLGD